MAMTHAEKINQLLGDIWQFRSANGDLTPLPEALQQRVAVLPEVGRWLKHHCPLCNDSLFRFTSPDITIEWCSREQAHFFLEKTSRPDWERNDYETEIAIRIGI